jgi:hypothetical protein
LSFDKYLVLFQEKIIFGETIYLILSNMKKVALISFTIGLALSLSSCYKHSVCATYVNNDVKIEKTVSDDM